MKKRHFMRIRARMYELCLRQSDLARHLKCHYTHTGALLNARTEWKRNEMIETLKFIKVGISEENIYHYFFDSEIENRLK